MATFPSYRCRLCPAHHMPAAMGGESQGQLKGGAGERSAFSSKPKALRAPVSTRCVSTRYSGGTACHHCVDWDLHVRLQSRRVRVRHAPAVCCGLCPHARAPPAPSSRRPPFFKPSPAHLATPTDMRAHAHAHARARACACMRMLAGQAPGVGLPPERQRAALQHPRDPPLHCRLHWSIPTRARYAHSYLSGRTHMTLRLSDTYTHARAPRAPLPFSTFTLSLRRGLVLNTPPEVPPRTMRPHCLLVPDPIARCLRAIQWACTNCDLLRDADSSSRATQQRLPRPGVSEGRAGAACLDTQLHACMH